MIEFEELPLHFPRKRGDRALYEEWDFLPPRLRPAPRRGAPRVVRVDTRFVRRGSDGGITRFGRRRDGGRVDRRLRRGGDRVGPSPASLQVARRRGDARGVGANGGGGGELRRATVRVAVALPTPPRGTWTRRWRSTRRFAADARKLWGTSWTRSGGGTARTFAPRRFASSVIFAVGAVGNAREREKRGSWRVWRTCDTRRCSFGSGRGESTPRRFAACDSSRRGGGYATRLGAATNAFLNPGGIAPNAGLRFASASNASPSPSRGAARRPSSSRGASPRDAA